MNVDIYACLCLHGFYVHILLTSESLELLQRHLVSPAAQARSAIVLDNGHSPARWRSDIYPSSVYTHIVLLFSASRVLLPVECWRKEVRLTPPLAVNPAAQHQSTAVTLTCSNSDTLPVEPSYRKTMAEEVVRKRETWARKFDFLLACIGFSVGLGNVWRFPYLCYKNGGGAFLIPYLICVLVGGIPLFFLEVAVGQFMSEGGYPAWRLCPLFQGIGITTTFIVFFLNCYYNVILAWAFYYMFASFTDVLPWSECGHYWNTENCTTDWAVIRNQNNTNATQTHLDPVTEFWENKVLNISSGITEVGEIKWDLAVTLVLAWFVVFFCIWQGVRTSGKVMYVTATSPYIFMTILLVRGATLPGALDGILFYMVPEWERMLDIQVWVDAGTQIFFSYSISLGALTALGSYNTFNHNAYRDSIIFAIANSGTSIFAGFTIFTTLGFMAHQQGTSIDKVAEKGPGLAFIAYPTAVSEMPVAPLWSALFFLMVILLGLDSQFVGVEGLVTAFVDNFPSLRKGHRKEIFIACACIVQMLVGLAMVTNGGMYVFQLFDYYTASRILLLVAAFMCIAVAWCYGVNRFYDNLEMMFGFRINPYMKISWVFTAPAFCIIIFIMSVVTYSDLDYQRPLGVVYQYPDWSVALGWSLAALAFVWIPLVAVIRLLAACCTGKPLRSVIEPRDLKSHQLRPQDNGGMDTEMVPPSDGKGGMNNPGYVSTVRV